MGIAGIAASAATVLALGLTGQPASAAQHAGWSPHLLFIPVGQRTCPDGYLCVFRDAFYEGGGVGIEEGREINDLGSLGLNDVMSSWINATRTRYCWGPDVNFEGIGHIMDPNFSVPVLRPEENDTASTIQRC
ncbi:peptidase inhibitor family I36 protein [Streptomyces sp. NPDC048419]|uniref:peptidase inhibitor family I36 protein n=1 Tax=Streptomyces sp. NPDC048419 TaxID=3365547 RepID=UPI003714AAFB